MAVSGILALGAWVLPASPSDAASPDNPVKLAVANAPFDLVPHGSYETGRYDSGATRDVAYHARSHRLFVLEESGVAVIDARDIDAPKRLFDLNTGGILAADGSTIPEGAVANAVAVRPDGLVLVAVAAPGNDGWLAFFDAWTAAALGAVRVGPAPTSLSLDGFGIRAVVVGGGAPGTTAIVGLPRRLHAARQSAVRVVPVDDPGAVTAGAGTAWVTDGDEIATIDLRQATVTGALPHGLEPGTVAGPVAHYTTHGRTYLVTDTGEAATMAGSLSVSTIAGEQVATVSLEQLAAVARANPAGGPGAVAGQPGSRALTVGEVDGRDYVFAGVGGVGGVAVFDLTEPTRPSFVSYLNNRDFSVDPARDLAAAGDLGPVAIVFVKAEDSPTSHPLLAVGNQVSGTTTIVELVPAPTDRTDLA